MQEILTNALILENKRLTFRLIDVAQRYYCQVSLLKNSLENRNFENCCNTRCCLLINNRYRNFRIIRN